LRSNVIRKPRGYWGNAKNVRKYFEEFAKENGFDPLVPANWGAVTASSVKAAKVF